MVFKLKPLTWVLAVVALLLGLGAVAWERWQGPKVTEAIAEPTPERYFNFGAEQVQSLAISQGEQTVRLYRSGKSDQGWLMDDPEPVAVSAAGVDFLLSVVLASRNDGRDFEAPSAELGQYGLGPARAQLTLQLVDGKSHHLLLGNADFKGDALYALVNPKQNADLPPAKQTISLLPRSLAELARRSPADWKQAELEPEDPKEQVELGTESARDSEDN